MKVKLDLEMFPAFADAFLHYELEMNISTSSKIPQQVPVLQKDVMVKA